MSRTVRPQWIDATTPAVGDCIEAIVELVLAHGGQCHPGLRLHEREGQLAVYCDPVAEGAGAPPLFSLPRAVLIPVDTLEWQDTPDTLQLRHAAQGLTPVQQQLLERHLALYNAAAKLPWAVHQHPRLALQQHPTLLAALQVLRPDFIGRGHTPAAVFLQTRVFGLAAVNAEASPAQPARSKVLMPLIDLLNHHPRGASFRVTDTAMQVSVKQPGPDGQCFAAYGGRRDVLDLALHYGYAERHTPFAFSAPVEVEVPGLGRVRVDAQRAKPAHPLDPPRVSFDAESLCLSHLACHREHPQRLRTVLKLALTAAAHRRGLSGTHAGRAVEAAVTALAEANLSALNRLRTTAQALAATAPVAAMFAEAAELQAAIIGEVFEVGLR